MLGVCPLTTGCDLQDLTCWGVLHVFAAAVLGSCVGCDLGCARPHLPPSVCLSLPCPQHDPPFKDTLFQSGRQLSWEIVLFAALGVLMGVRPWGVSLRAGL
jgi:hypothetical protein